MGLTGLIAAGLKLMSGLPTPAREVLASVRQEMPGLNAISLLHLGAEKSWLVTSVDADQGRLLELNLGTDKTAHSHFKGAIPTSLEVETIIATIEDEIMPLGRQIPAGSQLCTSDADLGEIAKLSGAQSGPIVRLTIEALEQLFNRWVAFVEGRPATQDPLPGTHRFALCLLILREVMHHWQVGEVIILKDALRSGA